METELSGRPQLKSKYLFFNSRGQVVIENVLLLVLSVGILFSVSRLLKERQVISNLVYGPQEKIAGMTESGVWASPEEARKDHPNSTKRILTVVPEEN